VTFERENNGLAGRLRSNGQPVDTRRPAQKAGSSAAADDENRKARSRANDARLRPRRVAVRAAGCCADESIFRDRRGGKFRRHSTRASCALFRQQSRGSLRCS
jgi:hypothetical protein